MIEKENITGDYDECNRIEEKYLVYIDYFVNKLSQYVDIRDTYYDKNILTLGIDKGNIINVIRGLFRNELLIADYSITSNKINLYARHNIENSIYHELLHMASSIYDKEKEVRKSGFFEGTKEYSVGYGIDEGYTEYLNIKYFSSERKCYLYEIIISRLVELIVSKNKMQKLYFKADLVGLCSSLAGYSTEKSVKNFIFKSDYILDNGYSIMKTQQVNRYRLDINHYLANTYVNMLIVLYNNKIITSSEVYNLYHIFMKELTHLLDIPLDINKDILYENIEGIREMQLYRVKKKV